MSQISYQVSFTYLELVGSMPLNMSVSMLKPWNCVARDRMSATERSVETESASVVTVEAMVAGSLARIFLRMAPMTMRWLAAR